LDDTEENPDEAGTTEMSLDSAQYGTLFQMEASLSQEGDGVKLSDPKCAYYHNDLAGTIEDLKYERVGPLEFIRLLATCMNALLGSELSNPDQISPCGSILYALDTAEAEGGVTFM
jgi:hypothetical protein